jgi:hypothetical protein
LSLVECDLTLITASSKSSGGKVGCVIASRTPYGQNIRPSHARIVQNRKRVESSQARIQGIGLRLDEVKALFGQRQQIVAEEQAAEVVTALSALNAICRYFGKDQRLLSTGLPLANFASIACGAIRNATVVIVRMNGLHSTRWRRY